MFGKVQDKASKHRLGNGLGIEYLKAITPPTAIFVRDIAMQPVHERGALNSCSASQQLTGTCRG